MTHNFYLSFSKQKQTWNKKRRKKYAFVPKPIIKKKVVKAKQNMKKIVATSLRGNENGDDDLKENAGEEKEEEEEDASAAAAAAAAADSDDVDKDVDVEDAENAENAENDGGESGSVSDEVSSDVEEEEDNAPPEMTIETEDEKEKRTFRDESMDRIIGVLKRHLEPMLTFVKTKCTMRWPIDDGMATSGILRLLDCLLDEHPNLLVDATLSAQQAQTLDNVLVWSMTWSVGAPLDEESREKFSLFLVKRLQEHESMLTTFEQSGTGTGTAVTEVTKTTAVDSSAAAAASFSSSSKIKTLFDVCLNHDQGSMVEWNTMVGSFEYDASLPYASLFVPTVESVRISVLLDLLINTPRDLDVTHAPGANDGVSHCVVCVGTSGVGKSVIIQRYLQEMCSGPSGDDFESNEIALSAQTTSHMLQSVFENKLKKLRKTMLGPSRGRRMILFVDDLNMPKPDEYGSQPPLELVRIFFFYFFFFFCLKSF